ncbi:MAG: efflux RND transporter periplasmic adaptor subunit [Burkholderiales bacterium]|nr:efflux RND transporter periplasmic adaptor subunit [Burkholderiales bacterium]
MKKLSWKVWAAAGAVVVLAGGGAWWWVQGRSPDVSYRTSRIERGPLQATVSASGAVNPVTQVSVGTQVSGQIKELYVDFNSEVKANQLIALIDPETFEYRVRQSQADVDAAQAAVLTAQANSAAARAAVSRSKVDLVEAQRDYDRKKMLVDKQFVAQSEADKAQALVNTTREALKSVEAQIGVTEAQVKAAMANVAQRQAALAQARIDLSRTRILSPVNGIVIKRAVEKGQTVAASLQAPELFVIAQNLQDMQVDASIDESDVGRIRTGQRATFTVDAYPGQTFEGEIRQVRKAAQNVANVVTYVAVVGFSNTGGRLLPGMTANVRVITDFRENVLKIPNAALRVRIAGVEPAAGGASAARPASGAVSWSLFSQAHAQPQGGGMAAMRERLVTELQLSLEQQAKLDAISADMRPQFMALRDVPEEQRGPAREKLLGEMRNKISAMLNAEQKKKYAEMAAPVASRPSAAAPSASSPAPAGPSRSAEGAQSAAPSAPSAARPPPPAGGPSGPLGEVRNRLVTDLQLSPPQVEKLDAIYADARPKFTQLRDLPPEERQKARERIMADIRARIGDILTPEQKPKFAVLQAEAASRTNTRGRIFLLGEDGKPKAFNVRLGITDGTSTELLVGPNSPEAAELKEGANVITGVVNASQPQPQRPPAGPRMGF